METAKTHIGFVSDFYTITPVQAVLFSLFIGQGEDKRINTYQITGSIGCTSIDILSYEKDIDQLISGKLLARRLDNEDRVYYVPFSVIKSLKANTAKITPEFKNLEINGLFDIVEKLHYKYDSKKIPFDDFISELNSLPDNTKN